MTKKDIIGRWYKCEACDKEIPIPDYIFINQDDKKIDAYLSCDFCKTSQTFKPSDGKTLCTKKEAQAYWKKENQIKEAKNRTSHYWEK